MRYKRRKKATRYRGSHTHARGGKKKARGKGHRGGKGLAGTGKRADQKKTLILNLYGKEYFGKKKRRARKPTLKLKTINLRDINTKQGSEVDLQGYKVLAEGELTKKVTIRASAASQSAIDKIKKQGSSILITRD